MYLEYALLKNNMCIVGYAIHNGKSAVRIGYESSFFQNV